MSPPTESILHWSNKICSLQPKWNCGYGNDLNANEWKIAIWDVDTYDHHHHMIVRWSVRAMIMFFTTVIMIVFCWRKSHMSAMSCKQILFRFGQNLKLDVFLTTVIMIAVIYIHVSHMMTVIHIEQLIRCY